MWVRERKPKTAAEAGQLAEDYVQACQSGTTTAPRCGVNWRQEAVKQRQCHTCNTVGHLARDCPQGSKNGGNHTASSPSLRYKKEVECYNCHQKGHIATKCPAAVLYCNVGTSPGRTGCKAQVRSLPKKLGGGTTGGEGPSGHRMLEDHGEAGPGTPAQDL